MVRKGKEVDPNLDNELSISLISDENMDKALL